MTTTNNIVTLIGVKSEPIQADGVYETTDDRMRPVGLYVAAADPKWMRRSAPFFSRAVVESDDPSWRQYNFAVFTQYGDCLDLFQHEASAQWMRDKLNERAALLAMTEGTLAEGITIISEGSQENAHGQEL